MGEMSKFELTFISSKLKQAIFKLNSKFSEHKIVAFP